MRVTVAPPLFYETAVRSTREPTLGELGASPLVAQVGSGVAGKGAAVGAASLASYAGAGAFAGPIGAAVGLIVGIVVTKLLAKQYLNVAQMNAAEGDEIAVFNQYRAISGQAPGRMYGLEAMKAVWKGALHSGYWPKNQGVQCFHNGCSAHPGDAELIDMVIRGGCGDRNCFPDLYPAFAAARATSASGALRSPAAASRMSNQMIPRANIAARGGTVSMRGLGALGITPTRPVSVMPYVPAQAQPVPEAVTFIDQFFIPANSPGAACGGAPSGCYWAAPSSDIEHQILYDVADAFLAQQPITTTPYIAAKPYAQPPAAEPAAAVAVVSPGVITPPQPMDHPMPIAPSVTTQMIATPQPVAASSKLATSVGAATQANLDASLAAQGFNRLGTTAQGVPIYGDTGGNSYLYSNGQLYPYGSIAQLAATGNAGTGISIPGTGLDPTTAGIIAAALAQGLTPAQAIQAGLNNLVSQGVPITPTVQAQLQAAASQGGGFNLAGVSPVMLGAGALVLFLVLRR